MQFFSQEQHRDLKGANKLINIVPVFYLSYLGYNAILYVFTKVHTLAEVHTTIHIPAFNNVLVSAGIELIFIMVAGMVLCFGFRRKISFITYHILGVAEQCVH